MAAKFFGIIFALFPLGTEKKFTSIEAGAFPAAKATGDLGGNFTLSAFIVPAA